ncbi:MAG: hypothetical protein CFH10_01431 [Alphaproteobacteria bacterium MarineAlpha4_Bin2]|nr:MAG: hypothetical protein CFH10_01431 [Alphaproteobacteria bacterium MarineAlpha4_Bin2]
MAKQHLFCFGLGYSVKHLAASLPPSHWRISGTTRNAEGRAAMAERGWTVFLFDGVKPLEAASERLASVTHIVNSIPPDAEGDPVIRHHAANLAAVSRLKWLGYLSTTGVYGDRGGEWVDEASERMPTGPRGRRRMEAEDAWLSLWQENQLPVHLFRLAGIYGPNRSALDTVRQGRARRIIKPGQVFSRIHVDDIAAVLKASMDRPDPGRAYNLCDNEAAPPQDVITYACKLLGVDAPPELEFEQAELSDMARSFYQDNKRVSNVRIKEDLGIRLSWPSYREGLQGLLS